MKKTIYQLKSSVSLTNAELRIFYFFVKLDVILLSKRLMLKPFITFTKTDVTRLYNNAETKNVIISYLRKNEFIKEIDNLFLSTAPTKNTFKAEVGYLKLFPVFQTIAETAKFEMRLREKIGITFDDYVKKVFYNGNFAMPTTITNNMFNTKHHNWLLNRDWFDKLKAGEISVYYLNKVVCPDAKMTRIAMNIVSISNDDGRTIFIIHLQIFRITFPCLI